MILLRHAVIVDGTGSPPVPGDVLIDADKIVAVGTFEQPRDAPTIDCTNLVLTPGFIDIHSHSDLQVLENDRAKTGSDQNWGWKTRASIYRRSRAGRDWRTFCRWPDTAACESRTWGSVSARRIRLKWTP